jgi:hypothetical protein
LVVGHPIPGPNTVVHLGFTGSNTLTTTNGTSAAIDCRLGASIYFKGGEGARLTARGAGDGAAIGSGFGHSCGLLDFNGGRFEAYGGARSAGIGTAANGTSARLGKLHIHNGTFFVRSRNGAGIAAGWAGDGLTVVDDLRIEGGVFDIAVTGGGAGIGSGYATFGNSSVNMITVTGGNLTLSGGHGAGIGSGYAAIGTSSVDRIMVTGGNLTLTGSSGTGIGSGAHGRAGSRALGW